jgi:hypothetical protein
MCNWNTWHYLEVNEHNFIDYLNELSLRGIQPDSLKFVSFPYGGRDFTGSRTYLCYYLDKNINVEIKQKLLNHG